MKCFKIIIITIAFLILLLPIAFINVKPDQISEIDNKKLPEITSVKEINDFNDYISKRIGFRNSMINIYTEMNDKLLGKLVHPSYSYGKDGYIFYKLKMEEHDDYYLESFAKLVKNMQTFVTERGSYFLFVINPTKISIYEQYLPEGYIFTNYRINTLKKMLDELEVNYIDNTECLFEASKTEQVYNIKYDAAHWNDRGAFVGINNILKKMQEDGINVNLLDESDYNIKYEHQDTLPNSNFGISEDTPKYAIKKQNYEFTKNFKSEIQISKAHSTYLETQSKSTGNKYDMLFFRGSYMNGKEMFVSNNNFDKVYYVHNYDNSINFDYYYNIMKPDIVLFEAVEYAIGDSFYRQKNMKNKKYNEVYDNFSGLLEQSINGLDENKIIDEIKNRILESNDDNKSLTTISIPTGEYKYAYLELDKIIYDFTYDNKKVKLTLNSDNIKNAKEVRVILIDSNKQYKSIINIPKN